MVRLFFALWPDESQREALAAATRAAVQVSDGRAVPSANLHVTLAFLGAVPEERVASVAGLGRQLASKLAPGGLASPGRELTLSFEQIEHWKKAQVLCAVAAEPVVAARALAAVLAQDLTASGFLPDLKPFRPHVTVARKVRSGPATEAIAKVSWSFTQFALMQSRTLPRGPEYSVVESFVLDNRHTHD